MENLKCPVCGNTYTNEDINIVEQYETIISEGCCIDCLENKQ